MTYLRHDSQGPLYVTRGHTKSWPSTRESWKPEALGYKDGVLSMTCRSVVAPKLVNFFRKKEMDFLNTNTNFPFMEKA